MMVKIKLKKNRRLMTELYQVQIMFGYPSWEPIMLVGVGVSDCKG